MDVAAERAYPTPFANSTLLPILLLSLVQQKHSPETSRTIRAEYDFVIVGGGSAGSVVASRLSEMPCVSVLLLEAGKPPPLLTDVPSLARFFWFTDIDWQYRTAPQRYTAESLTDRQIIWPSGKTLGGSSILNGNIYVRGNRRDYDRWAEAGADGWSYEDVLPYFKKMEDNRDPEYLSNGLHGVGGPVTVHRPRYQAEYKDPLFRTADALGYKVVDPGGYKQTGFNDMQGTLRAGQRCSTAKAYLVPGENRTNLDILPYAMVRKVLISKRRAVGVEFDFQGTTYVVKARKEVIMSAGTINTAQLLMLSGIGPRKELQRLRIPVIADLPVGRNLQDQCGTFLNFDFTQNIPRVTDKLTDPANIRRYINNRTGPLGSTEFISALAFLNNKVVEPKEAYPDYQLYFNEAQTEVALQIGLRPEVFDQYYGPLQGKSFYLCVSSLLHPKSRGTVTLNSTNPYDPPVIDPNYFEDPDDIKAIVEGLKTCMRFGNHPIMREVGSSLSDVLFPGCEQYAGNEDWYFTCLARNMVVTFSHQVGTATMGNPNDPKTVVDTQLRVLNIKGLRVVDASVMPLVPSGNTNVPTIMVAEKASDIIKSTLECFNDYDDEWNNQESNWQEDSQQPNYYDYGQEWKQEKTSFWPKPQTYPTNPNQYEIPLKIKNQQTNIDHWVHEPQSHVILNQGHHVVPWNKEILSVGKFTVGENAMDIIVNQNFPVSDDLEEEQKEFSNSHTSPSYNRDKQQEILIRPQIENTPPPSNTQNTRLHVSLNKPQSPPIRLQMQMSTTPMPDTNPTTRAPATMGNRRPMLVKSKNITITIQKSKSQMPILAKQIKNKLQEISEQFLIPKPPNEPQNSMQSNTPSNLTQSNTNPTTRAPATMGNRRPMPGTGKNITITIQKSKSQMPILAKQIQNKIQEILEQLLIPKPPNAPQNLMQSNTPSNLTQFNRPFSTIQSSRPSSTLQSSRPSSTMQSNNPSSGSNMRPDILEQMRKLKQMSSCDEEFCNSLLKFIECNQQACLKRAQFALYMYNILCSSPNSTT